ERATQQVTTERATTEPAAIDAANAASTPPMAESLPGPGSAPRSTGTAAVSESVIAPPPLVSTGSNRGSDSDPSVTATSATDRPVLAPPPAAPAVPPPLPASAAR